MTPISRSAADVSRASVPSTSEAPAADALAGSDYGRVVLSQHPREIVGRLLEGVGDMDGVLESRPAGRVRTAAGDAFGIVVVGGEQPAVAAGERPQGDHRVEGLR